MTSLAIERPRIRPIVPTSPLIPCPAIEELFCDWPTKLKDYVGGLLLKPINERIAVMMSGNQCFSLSQALGNLAWGATAFGLTNTTIYSGLWAAALDDTLSGATSSECAYTSYGRMATTNNTTIFAAGSGTTSYTKTFPSDAVHSWAASTGTGTNNTVTYMGFLNGNAGTSGDKGYAWCSITSTTINNGDTPQLAQNAVSIVID